MNAGLHISIRVDFLMNNIFSQHFVYRRYYILEIQWHKCRLRFVHFEKFIVDILILVIAVLYFDFVMNDWVVLFLLWSLETSVFARQFMYRFLFCVLRLILLGKIFLTHLFNSTEKEKLFLNNNISINSIGKDRNIINQSLSLSSTFFLDNWHILLCLCVLMYLLKDFRI